MDIAKFGWSDYQIVISDQKNKYELEAAELLKTSLFRITGAFIPIVSNNEKSKNHELIIGSKTIRNFENDVVAKDSFVIFRENEKIFIAGKSRANVLGVAYFIQKYLGVIMTVENDISYITQNILLINNIKNELQKPDFEYRLVYSSLSFSRDYSNHNLASLFGNDSQTNYKTFEDTGNPSHSILPLLGHDKYFKSNSEFYALIAGKRKYGENIMPCLSNNNVFDIIVANLRKRIADEPNFKIWDVSQPDGILDSSGYCSCNLCKPKHDRGNGLSETLFPFVNKIALKFPDKIIRTLAYNITSKPHTAKTIISSSQEIPGGRCVSNVEVMYTLTNNNKIRAVRTANDESSILLRRELDLWTKSTKRLFIWDYGVNYSYILFPFPTLHVAKDNLAYFKSKGTASMFMELTAVEWCSMKELKTFVYSSLFWDHNQDLDKLISRFCADFYGAGAMEMKQYIDLLHENAMKADDHKWEVMSSTGSMIEHANPQSNMENSKVFSIKHLEDYYKLIHAALSKTRGTKYYFRIKRELLCLKFVEIETATKYANKKNSVYSEQFVGYFKRNKKNILDILNEFQALCKELEIDVVSEWGRTVNDYTRDVKEGLI